VQQGISAVTEALPSRVDVIDDEKLHIQGKHTLTVGQVEEASLVQGRTRRRRCAHEVKAVTVHVT